MKKTIALLLYMGVCVASAEAADSFTSAKAPVSNFSEIAPLKKVLLQRPGNEFLNLTPNSLERLLFDDIPYLKAAQAEHDVLAETLRAEGVEVVYLTDLIARSPVPSRAAISRCSRTRSL